eukprot:CAMPEP_0184691896 /NCGR_PEP_ID=MMETSP0313-20130426/598_1 /TAXON_ID=2792 /ORGANISM="Porphyridium aerugineum, Strain SAG 1380-2" /LENGTH=54 /DNA_ID=CAMNT_0027149675 /DNA_START=31 /DNA_END=195 /DNA_ORIENTATION=-
MAESNAVVATLKEIWDREYGIEQLRQANKKLLINVTLFTLTVVAFKAYGHLFAI